MYYLSCILGPIIGGYIGHAYVMSYIWMKQNDVKKNYFMLIIAPIMYPFWVRTYLRKYKAIK